MKAFVTCILLGILSCPATLLAEHVVAERTLRAGTIINADDLRLENGTVDNGISDPELIIGMEADRAIYAGHIIQQSDIVPPALVERNQIVTLVYQNSTISIATEGRALARGRVGEDIRVMNLTSRTTITGRVTQEGTVHVVR